MKKSNLETERDWRLRSRDWRLEREIVRAFYTIYELAIGLFN